MLRTLFYMPASKQKFFNALKLYQPHYFIFDIGDSVNEGEYTGALQNLISFREYLPSLFHPAGF